MMLSGDLFSRLAEYMKPITLTQDMKLSRPNLPHDSVVFPGSGIVSMVETSTTAWQEVALFGREGMAGAFGLLSPGSSLFLEIVQVPGSGFEVDMDVMRHLMEADGELRGIVLAYVRTMVFQLSMTAVMNVKCTVEQRLARWLMMIQDRIGSDRLSLTHDYISVMLGVARPSVSLSLAALERQGMIAMSRRCIHILERDRLAAVCGKYYGEAEHERGTVMRRHGSGTG